MADLAHSAVNSGVESMALVRPKDGGGLIRSNKMTKGDRPTNTPWTQIQETSSTLRESGLVI